MPRTDRTAPYPGSAQLSRRSVLGGLVALGAGSFAAATVRLGLPGAWTPSSDTWPLCRYDPQRTAANSEATLPADPAIAWEDTSLHSTGAGRTLLVVGPETVYAAGAGTVALARRDGTRRWQALTEPPGPDPTDGGLALHEGVLVVASGSGNKHVFRTDGTELWSDDDEFTECQGDSLVVANGTLFTGGEEGTCASRLTAHDTHWIDREAWGSTVVLAEDGLYAATGEGVRRYGPRSLLDVFALAPPPLRWQTPLPDRPAACAAGGSALVVGVEGYKKPASFPETGLFCLGRQQGDIRWQEMIQTPSQPTVPELAVSSDYCFVGLSPVDPVRDDAPGPRSRIVECRRTKTGTRLWRRRFEASVRDLAVVGDTLLVATGASEGRRPTGGVFALDPAEGSIRWRHPVGGGCRALAPVDGTIFATTMDGRVLALR